MTERPVKPGTLWEFPTEIRQPHWIVVPDQLGTSSESGIARDVAAEANSTVRSIRQPRTSTGMASICNMHSGR